MKDNALILFLIWLCFIMGCQNERESITQSSSRTWSQPSNGLRCSINVEKTRWSKGDSVLVSFIVENVSRSKVDLKTIPAFTLDETRYWCPIDIVGKDHTLPANARSTICLEKGTSINSTINISRLGWDRCISSVWPAQHLYSLVPPGQYKLRLDIEVIDVDEPKWIRSNEVEVFITE
jgi:hypothetical protein